MRRQDDVITVCQQNMSSNFDLTGGVVIGDTIDHVSPGPPPKSRQKSRTVRRTVRAPSPETSKSPQRTATSPHRGLNKATAIRLKDTFSSIKRKKPRFGKFLELPTEIRLLIWEYTIIPRVHELHPCAKLYNDRMTFRSNSSQTPSIFHVCRESRELALKNYSLMSYEPRTTGFSGKGILRFYFSPKLDTLFLNSLMGLFIMFMLLEDEDDYVGVGVMKGWQKVAFDAGRVQLISLFAGIAGHTPKPRLKAVFPSLKDFTIAFDYTTKGKIRFRTSVWPGENGTSLEEVILPTVCEYTGSSELEWAEKLNRVLIPMRHYLDYDFKNADKDCVPTVKLANVRRKAFVRGDIRYAFRKTCSFLGMKPRGPFRRL
ncbi:hypothetical protein K3495_g1331 [Podosphaera aphanis]|nr:hypothetical protein K3495_g1331 [Podosphaera aphanis]